MCGKKAANESSKCDDLAFPPFTFLSRNNKDVLIRRQVLLDIGDFFVNITLHAAAARRVKLRQITNLQDRRSGARFQFAQVIFGLQRGHAARAGGCHRLFINAVRHIASDEDPGIFTLRKILGD